MSLKSLISIFDECHKAFIKKDFALLEQEIRNLSSIYLDDQARKLYEYYSSKIPLKRISTKKYAHLDKSKTNDLGVIILMTGADESQILKSVESIDRFKQSSGLLVEITLFECIESSIDIFELADQLVNPLPISIAELIEASEINYLVDHGNTSRALQKAIRTSSSRYINIIREGDQLELKETNGLNPISKIDKDLLLISQFEISESYNALKNLKINSDRFLTHSIPISTSIAYDGSFFIAREYLDKLLSERVSYDAGNNFFGYLNEILVLDFIQQSPSVSYHEGAVCLPSNDNLNQHVERIKSYTLFCIEERLKIVKSPHESEIVKLFIEILRNSKEAFLASEHSQIQYFKKKSSHFYNNDVANFSKYFAYYHALNLRSIYSAYDEIELIEDSHKITNLEEPKVSLITSCFKGEKIIFSFLQNIADQVIVKSLEIIIVTPTTNLIQDLAIEYFLGENLNIKYVKLGSDPGIYECWNIAAKLASGKYLSNANLDDRRDPYHLDYLIKKLDETDSDVASAAVKVTHSRSDIINYHSLDKHYLQNFETWYVGKHDIEYKLINDFFLFNESGELIQCMNFVHCMPVWKKSLHAKFGYFDEGLNGTYADFAFWLEVSNAGFKFLHISTPLGLYLVDTASHNRLNSSEILWRSIVEKYVPKEKITHLPSHINERSDNFKSSFNSGGLLKFNFGTQLSGDFGNHRAGWSYVINGFNQFSDPDSPVDCITFLEKQFVWGTLPGEGASNNPTPLVRPWVGFLHVPPNVPSWFQFEQSNQIVFSKRIVQESLKNCLGIFVLTEYHKRFVENYLKPKFPISVLYHPTEFTERNFDYERYSKNPKKRLIQVGWWLRKLNAVSKIQTTDFTPTILGKNDWNKCIVTYSERRITGEARLANNVEYIPFLSNDDYDELLTENIIFLDFYDTSANNAVIECIARGTPILVCRHPAVEEYLGRDYPLFYSNYREAAELIQSNSKIIQAAQYLKSEKLKSRLHLNHFIDQFKRSEVSMTVMQYLANH